MSTLDLNRFERLCQAAFDGTATEEDLRQLERFVLTSDACRIRYVDLCELHGGLTVLADLGATRPDAFDRSALAGRPPNSRNSWKRLFVGGVSVAVVAGLVAVLLFGGHNEGGEFATLVSTRAARWSSASAPTDAGARIGRSRLKLAEGLAAIRFDSGATVELEGPADLELLTPQRCRMLSGKLVTTVDSSLKGFVVETPYAILTDQGTCFGVEVSPNRGTLVGVFDGRVDVEHVATGQIRTVNENSSLRLFEQSIEALDLSQTEGSFRPSSQGEGAINRTVQISTAVGAGSDHWIQRNEEQRSGPSDLLLVKNAVRHLPGFDRKAYLRFDLSGVDQQRISEASLQLTLAPTGLGYAARVPDCTFAVFAVFQDSADGWDPATLNWDNAPGNDESSSGMAADSTKRLGRFTVPQGQQSGEFGIDGAALLDVLRKDANLLVTFVIVRETQEPDSEALVHGFAGRRHATLPPPTLRLQMLD